jgi:hypothetical protein
MVVDPQSQKKLILIGQRRFDITQISGAIRYSSDTDVAKREVTYDNGNMQAHFHTPEQAWCPCFPQKLTETETSLALPEVIRRTRYEVQARRRELHTYSKKQDRTPA